MRLETIFTRRNNRICERSTDILKIKSQEKVGIEVLEYKLFDVAFE